MYSTYPLTYPWERDVNADTSPGLDWMADDSGDVRHHPLSIHSTDPPSVRPSVPYISHATTQLSCIAFTPFACQIISRTHTLQEPPQVPMGPLLIRQNSFPKISRGEPPPVLILWDFLPLPIQAMFTNHSLLCASFLTFTVPYA